MRGGSEFGFSVLFLEWELFSKGLIFGLPMSFGLLSLAS